MMIRKIILILVFILIANSYAWSDGPAVIKLKTDGTY